MPNKDPNKPPKPPRPLKRYEILLLGIFVTISLIIVLIWTGLKLSLYF